jgi:Bacterial Ig-like domain (group 3)
MRQQQSLVIPTALSATRSQSAGSFLPGVSASSGLAVTVTASPSSVCLLSSGRIYPRASGRCTVTLSQAGNTLFAPAVTTTRTFTVLGSTSAGVTISDSTLTTTQSAIVTARVARTTAAAASLAGGTVRFYDGSRLLASRALGSSATAAIYLPTRSRGTHYLRVMYLGSSWYSPSSSSWLRISVR